MDTLSPTTLTCPKCGGALRLIERSGIHIDQCVECRGVFLDRGELDRLLDLEAGATSSARDRHDPGSSWSDDDDDWTGGRRGRRPDRRGGFLNDLFQGFGD
jgi:Zn-finger nucleic acid-binding protein